jgi:hypothetical protein
MPNFNTHWLVAWLAADSAPEWIQDGGDLYVKKITGFSQAVRKLIVKVNTPKAAADFGTTVAGLAEDFRGDLKSPKNYDNVTCFSAYMCGACGPDFWTLPQLWQPVTLGEHHFDLGHYNRTHRQFFVSVDRLKGTDKSKLQAKVEMAYFLGMATHVAADLVIHQLVNRSAGAYNLLEKNWMNEQGHSPAPIWSTHNKVEHYWDSYVRLRYLGDFGPVFAEEKDEKPKRKPGKLDKRIAPLNLPVIEKLLESVRDPAFRKGFLERAKEAGLEAAGTMSVPAFAMANQRAAEVLAALEETLAEEETRIALERPLTFPQIFADRLIAGELAPFIYGVVVDKKKGAYEEEAVPKEVTKEANSRGMRFGNDNFSSEKNKVNYFSSKSNTGTSSVSNNYLTYYVCPDLSRLRLFGRNAFYDLEALEPFIQRAVAQAKTFVGELKSAYESNSTYSLRNIARFWNLDTGLGLRVVRRPTQTSKEVITQLDFVHVLDPKGGGRGDNERIDYEGGYPYLPGDPKKEATEWRHEKGQAFPVCSAGPFKELKDVREESGKYLDSIPLAGPTELTQSPREVEDELFFPVEKSLLQKAVAVWTASRKKENVIRISELAHRLNLQLRVGVSKLGSDSVGFFLQGDEDGVKGGYKGKPGAWLEKTRMLDLGVEGKSGPADLRRFTTRLLANLEASMDLKPSANGWNNVIPYKDNEKNYGRNFAISTGRSRVLNASFTVRKNFDGRNDFGVRQNISPTEQIFFTLHPLVRTPDGVFDIFSKKEVSKEEMKEIRRIQSVGFVKIVLFYELGPNGGCQLGECYVDGLRVAVEDDWAAEG